MAGIYDDYRTVVDCLLRSSRGLTTEFALNGF